MIHLSSFFGPGEGPRYSIARWAPKGFRGDRTTLAWLGARKPDGTPLRHVEPPDFRDLYLDYLTGPGVWEKLTAWLDALDPAKDTTLCCWCTPERQRPHPKLFCHRILVGYTIEHFRPDVPVAYLDGAERPVWERPGGWGGLEVRG